MVKQEHMDTVLPNKKFYPDDKLLKKQDLFRD